MEEINVRKMNSQTLNNIHLYLSMFPAKTNSKKFQNKGKTLGGHFRQKIFLSGNAQLQSSPSI